MKSDQTTATEIDPIVVDNLTKKFTLWHQRADSLKSTLINLVRSKELTQEKFTPLDEISFSVKRGETLGIIGHNGSGKTTLLRVLAGITAPTTGTVKVQGKVSTLFELGTGFHAELSGRENIYLNGTILGLSRKEIDQKYAKIVEFAELEKFIDSPIKHYSSGMQMRLAFAVAISIDPDVLLVDEVLAVGDTAFQAKSYSAFQDFKRRGTTTVFVTHDLEAVKANCDRAILLNDGRILAEGKPNDVVNRYRLLVEGGTKNGTSFNETDSEHIGDQKVTVERVWLTDANNQETRNIGSDEEINIHVQYQIHEDVVNPIFGITLTTRDGKQVFVTNTLWKNVPTGQLTKGQVVEVSFALANIFERGYYSISPAAAHDNGKVFHDWRINFLEFNIHKPYLTSGITNPDHTINLKIK